MPISRCGRHWRFGGWKRIVLGVAAVFAGGSLWPSAPSRQPPRPRPAGLGGYSLSVTYEPREVVQEEGAQSNRALFPVSTTPPKSTDGDTLQTSPVAMGSRVQLSESVEIRKSSSQSVVHADTTRSHGVARVAYATLDVSPKSRHKSPRTWVWAGVVGWAQSLRSVGGIPNNADIVVMTLRNDTLVPGVAEIYRQLKIKVVFIPEFKIPTSQTMGGAWYLPWHKLGVWTLTDYDTVVYMDCDMMALKPTAELFDVLPLLPHVQMYAATTFACGGTRGDPALDYPSWTSGIMVLRPNMTIFTELNEFAGGRSLWGSQVEPATVDADSDGKFRNDQRFLAEFFTMNSNMTGRKGYFIAQNVYHIHPALCRGQKPKGQERSYWEDARLTHFGCVTKPWRKPARPDPGCGGVLRQRWTSYFMTAINISLANADPATCRRTRQLAKQAIG